MPSITVPNEQEARIIRENGMDPERYGVEHRAEDYIVLLCYKTRDTVTIRRGDRKW